MITISPRSLQTFAFFAILSVAPMAQAQELPQDLIGISAADALALNVGRLYRFSSYLPGSPPLPPAILLADPTLGEGSGSTTNLFYSPSFAAIFWDDRETVVLEMASQAAMNRVSLTSQEDEQRQELGAQGPYATTDFYLYPISLASNLFNAVLYGTTNGSNYLITSTEALDPATNSVWLVEGTLQGGADDGTQFALGIGLRTNNLFISAQACDDACAATNLPLAWQLYYFGVTGVDPTADYDNDGVNNLAEFLGGTDPNKIVFAPRFANYHINSTTASGTFTIYRGVPSQMAILVNSDDFSAAQWQPYTPNFTVALGATDGVYNVWIGLGGLSTNSQQSWSWTRLTRDLHPPDIVITSPASNVTAQPLIDLRGYSPEPLLNLSYDVANDAGLQTNRRGAVTDQCFDQNTHEFSTNSFLCWDIKLTNGVNTITLRATDLAGNVSTNVFTYTLDLALGTNPPALSLYWPQDGEIVSGSVFTVRGQLDDPTATLAAQITDTAGNTTVVKGLVERNGLVWVENLPLASGTNTVTLTMTNAAGYSSTTNFTVVHSDDVNLTIDDVPPDQLSTRVVTVTGTIDSADYAVWVNGVAATNMIDMQDGTWFWEADGVFLNSGGTATIQAVAIPNSVNGGQGTGMETPVDNAVPGNPQAPSRRAAEKNPEQQFLADTKEYHYSLDDTWEADCWDGQWETAYFATHSDYTNLVKFTPPPLPANGLLLRTAYSEGESTAFDGYDAPFTSSWSTAERDYYFPKANPPWWAAVTLASSPPPTVSSNSTAAGPPPAPWKVWGEHTPYKAFPGWGVVTGALNHTERVVVKLRTGGKRLSDRQSFFSFQGSATNFPALITTSWSLFLLYAVSVWTTEPVVPEAVQVLGKPLIGLGMDWPYGLTYKTLPDNQEFDITPTVPCDRYTFGLQVLKHTLVLTNHCPVNGNGERTDVGVGEETGLSFAAPLILNDYWQNTWSTTAGSVSPTNGNATWFTAPSNASPATVTATVGDEKLDVSFSVYEPSGYAYAQVTGVGCYPSSPANAQAGMNLRVVIGPTNVSFYRVTIMEVGMPATNKFGYFSDAVNGAPSHVGHGAGVPITLGCDNSWIDQAWGGVYLPPWSGNGWSGGSFTWPIPAVWWIGPTNPMSGWQQDFSLGADGTVTVTKFGHSVTRHANQSCGTAQ